MMEVEEWKMEDGTSGGYLGWKPNAKLQESSGDRERRPG